MKNGVKEETKEASKIVRKCLKAEKYESYRFGML